MNKYITLPDGITFQRTPAGATLCKVVEDSKNWKQKFRKSINMDGARLLELCDGKTALGDMIARHNRLYPSSLITEERAEAFFNKTEDERMVVSYPEKIKAKVRFCGSYEHFYPQHTSIELTDQCNYKCKHCYRGSSPQASLHLDFAKLKEYINALWENGGSVVELTGGEPMLYRHFFELVDFACGKMELVAILTNGYYLQEKEVERLAGYKDIVMLNISLDSCRPDYHDEFRGKKGAFEKTVKAMELLGKHGFTYRVGMMITEENFFDIEGTIKLAKKHGAKIFGFNPVLDMGRGEQLCAAQKEKKDRPDPQKLLEYEKFIVANYRDYIHFVTAEQESKLRSSNCGAVHRSVVLGPDGELRPCVMFGGEVIKIGNIYKQSFKEIFEGGPGAFFSKLQAPKREVCGDCPHLQYCQNCILKGVKMGLKTPECAWIKNTGVLDHIKTSPQQKVCGNVQEPFYG